MIEKILENRGGAVLERKLLLFLDIKTKGNIT